MASIRGLIALLATTTLSSPLAEISALEPRQQFTLPSRTLANGANNPFFPCGLDPSTCPYRCYDLPPASTNSTQNNLSVLQSRCFTQAQAADYVDLSKHPASEGHACVKCVKPLAVEVPKSKSAPVNCQPLETYFRATAGYGDNALREFGFARPFPGAALPSRCGSRADPIPECAWECAAAQVPFSVCDSQNTTGTFRQCNKCIPQCSTPVTVGGLALPQRGPNVSNVGACSQGVGVPLCPWSCQTAGRNNQGGDVQFRYCSTVNKTDDNFTTCQKCPQK